MQVKSFSQYVNESAPTPGATFSFTGTDGKTYQAYFDGEWWQDITDNTQTKPFAAANQAFINQQFDQFSSQNQTVANSEVPGRNSHRRGTQPVTSTQTPPVATPNQAPTLPPDQVKQLQNLLVKAGYSVGSAGVDGKLGTNTLSAMIQYMNKSAVPAGTQTDSPSVTGAQQYTA